MKPDYLTPQILEKLGFSDPVDFDVKPDGELVVLDRTCQKYKFAKKDYENLLEDAPLQPEKIANPKGAGGADETENELIAESSKLIGKEI